MRSSSISARADGKDQKSEKRLVCRGRFEGGAKDEGELRLPLCPRSLALPFTFKKLHHGRSRTFDLKEGMNARRWKEKGNQDRVIEERRQGNKGSRWRVDEAIVRFSAVLGSLEDVPPEVRAVRNRPDGEEARRLTSHPLLEDRIKRVNVLARRDDVEGSQTRTNASGRFDLSSKLRVEAWVIVPENYRHFRHL